jgi:hypothetical protein
MHVGRCPQKLWRAFPSMPCVLVLAQLPRHGQFDRLDTHALSVGTIHANRDSETKKLPYLLARWLSTLILQKHRYLIFGSARLHSTFHLVLLWCFQYCTKKLCCASPMPQAYLTTYQAQTPLFIFLQNYYRDLTGNIRASVGWMSLFNRLSEISRLPP